MPFGSECFLVEVAMRIYPYARQPIKNHLATIALCILCAVTVAFLAAAPNAWAGPPQQPLQQTIPPAPTPTPPPSCGPTEVTGGQIVGTVTWYQACSPYTISGNVVVSNGATLSIEPGVEVRFAAGKAMQIDGTLIVRGTASQPVIFTSSAATPAAGDWGFIKFADSSVDTTFDANGNYTGGSILQYCQVAYSGASSSSPGYGQSNYGGAIQIESASPFIDNCEIHRSGTAGIRADSATNLRISNNSIHHNKASGVRLYNGTATIKNNTLTYNDTNGGVWEGYNGGGIYVSGGSVTITDNTITNNNFAANDGGGGGVMISGNIGAVTISNNVISGNTGSSGYNGPAGGVFLGLWSSSSGTVIITNNTIQYLRQHI